MITSLSDIVIKGTKHKYNLKMALKVRQSLFHLMRFFLYASAIVNNVFLSSVIKKTTREPMWGRGDQPENIPGSDESHAEYFIILAVGTLFSPYGVSTRNWYLIKLDHKCRETSFHNLKLYLWLLRTLLEQSGPKAKKNYSSSNMQGSQRSQTICT